MSKLTKQKRIWICTLVALGSGFCGAIIGSNVNWQIHQQKCQSQPWGVKTLCSAWVTPGAIWQGSTTGACLGTFVGAIASAWVTRNSFSQRHSAIAPAKLQAQITAHNLTDALNYDSRTLELTAAQRQILRRFLALLLVKLACTDSESQAEIPLDELQRLITLAEQLPLDRQDISWEQAHQLLLKLKLEEPVQSPPTADKFIP